MILFYLCLFVVCGCTLAYEVLLTRLLSVVAWYYLVFVSVSMGMFGMTVGALVVQRREDLFDSTRVPQRLAQAATGLALSLPLALLTLLSVPVVPQPNATALYGFVLLCACIAVPFFFSGIIACLSLTRSPDFPVSRTYAADLMGGTAGCFVALGLLSVTDPSSGVLVLSSVMFLVAAGYASRAGLPVRRLLMVAAAMAALGMVNGRTSWGIRSLWAKEQLERRDVLTEAWSPVSRVRAFDAGDNPSYWGRSPVAPPTHARTIVLDIDNDASTPITQFAGNPADVDFLRWDVTSFAAELRQGGEAAIIGVGGGRDVLNLYRNRYARTVGIEVNPAILSLVTQRFGAFSGLSHVPNLSIHLDEGRSYLVRSPERFDFIQASMVDSWAATNAGAMSLTENGLYTVDGWRVFVSRLKPGGVLAFSRWVTREGLEMRRLFALAWATLLEEGVEDPGRQIVILRSPTVATLALSNRPFTPQDLQRVDAIAEERQFGELVFPGRPSPDAVLRAIAACRTTAELARVSAERPYDIRPPYDASPFFFNTIRLRHLADLLVHERFQQTEIEVGSARAMLVLLMFLAAAAALVVVTLVWPLRGVLAAGGPTLWRAATYFLCLGLGFMAVEMGMMQQLSLLLGQPVLSLVVVLAGLLLASGMGSLLSGRWPMSGSLAARLPALASAALALTWAGIALPVVHGAAAAHLPGRVAVTLAVVCLPGLAMGMCFPTGVRVVTDAGRADALPWLWSLNGAASVLATFVAVVVAMEASLAATVILGAACYLVAALALPVRRPA